MTECHNTKTKVITTTKQNKVKYHKEGMKWENKSDEVEIGLGFIHDWLKGGASFLYQPHNVVKQSQFEPSIEKYFS